MEVNKLFLIDKRQTSAYHPECNGTTERFNGTLLNMLRSVVSLKQRDWDIYLNYLMFAYRTSEHSSTKETAFFLMFGRDALHPLDVSFTAPPISTIDTPTYLDKLLVNLPFAWNLGKE